MPSPKEGLKPLPLLDGTPSLVRELVFRAVRGAGPAGITPAAAALAVGITPDQADQHLNDLERFGFVAYCGRLENGRMVNKFVNAEVAHLGPSAG